MSAYTPVNYTNLANGIIGAASVSSASFAPLSKQSVIRLHANQPVNFRIDSAASATAGPTNPLISAGVSEYVRIQGHHRGIASIEDASGTITIVTAEPDNEMHHGFEVGDLVHITNTTNYNALALSVRVVASVVNGSAFTIGTSGGNLAEETTGDVRKGYILSQKGLSATAGVITATEVSMQG